jgi:peptidoglycan/LPS O-acetylase OafA/YrhL
VLAIIVFHTTSQMPGGFLGIDAFFVLSGYLITSLLLRERLGTGRIRLGEFWARRARRLLPALLLVVLAVALLEWITDPIDQLDARRSDLLASLLYYANWHFAAVGEDYFALVQDASPLRHIWSLAVEEQYYLAWPLMVLALMALLGGRLRLLLAVCIGGAVVSAVAMAALYEPGYPERAYFGTDARAHQLLIGGALAVLMELRPWNDGGRLAAWLGALAAAAAGVAVFIVPEGASFYFHGGSVLFALAVAVGIWSLEVAPRGGLARLLSLPALVWVGLISYGLYLWHWPLVVWSQDSEIGTHERQLLIWVIAFLLAAASYYAVERPVREGRLPWLGFSGRRLAVLAPLALALGAGLCIAATRPEGSEILVAQAEADKHETSCPEDSPAVRGRSYCVRVAADSAGAPVIVTAGDSTSLALDPGLRLVAARRGWRYIQAGQGGCPLAPVELRAPWDTRFMSERRRLCPIDIPAMLAAVARRESPDVWIVVDRHGNLPIYDHGRVLPTDHPRHATLFRAALRRALSILTADGAEVVILAAPPPALPSGCIDDPKAGPCKSSTWTAGDPVTRRLNSHYRAVAGDLPGVTIVSITDVLCPGGGACPVLMNGRLPRWDGIHFTVTYSRRIVPTIIARAERAGVRFRARGSG